MKNNKFEFKMINYSEEPLFKKSLHTYIFASFDNKQLNDLNLDVLYLYLLVNLNLKLYY